MRAARREELVKYHSPADVDAVTLHLTGADVGKRIVVNWYGDRYMGLITKFWSYVGTPCGYLVEVRLYASGRRFNLRSDYLESCNAAPVS